jgi:hypothetical protein
MNAGERFCSKVLRDAIHAMRPRAPKQPPVRDWLLPELPAGCEWIRPAPGWIDLRKVSK